MKARSVLFVISRDFGELSVATIFARNQSFCAHYAIPEDFYQYFDETATSAVTFTAKEDLYDIIDRIKPDMVIMYSGYLLGNSKLFLPGDLDEFRVFLAQRKIKVAVSDPFARLFDYYPDTELKFDDDEVIDLQEELKYLEHKLRNVNHVYGFPFMTDKVKAFKFYNERYIDKNYKRESHGEDRKNWLFVLSSLDYQILLHRYESAFSRILKARLSEVSSNGNNHVTLIMPEHCSVLLQETIQSNNNIEYVKYCSLGTFEEYIRSSDVVFYWNIFSNSVLLCFYYNIPALFFDKGHMAILSEEANDHISKYIHAGSAPDYISFESELSSDLSLLLMEYYSVENRKSLIGNYKRLDSPDNIVNRICS